MVFKKLTWRKLLTVEPVIFLYAFGMFMHQPVIQQFIYYRVSEMKNFTYDINKGPVKACDTKELNGTSKALESQVQSWSSYIHIGVTMFASIPSIFMSLFMGTWTDRVGRKPALIAPIFGSLFESIIVLLTMYLKWPIYVLFIGAAVNGFCGFFTTIVLAVMSYIADTTDEAERGLRLAVMELLTFCGGAISQLTSGLWIRTFGFTPPYWFIVACYIGGILHVVFFVPESRLKKDNEPSPRLFSVTGLKKIFTIFKHTRSRARRNILLLMFSSSLVTMTNMGLGGVINLFLLHSPLCFSPEYVGFYAALRLFLIGVGAVLGIKTLGLCITELNVSRVGIVSAIAGLSWLAFSDTSWKVFLSPILGMFTGCIVPVYRGMMSRMVSEDQQGAMFSPVAALDSICSLCGAFIFSTLYPASLKFGFKGFVFLLAATLMLIPFMLICCLKNASLYMSKRDLVRFGSGNKYEKIEEPVGDAESIPSPPKGETSPIQRHLVRSPSYTETTPGEK